MKQVALKVRSILLALAFSALWTVTVGTIMADITGTPIDHSLPDNAVLYLIFACLITPLWEEAVYRYAPLELGRGLGVQNKLPIIVLSCFFFAISHGQGYMFLMIHGVLGAVFSWVYLKSGYASAVITHSCWNFIVGFNLL